MNYNKTLIAGNLTRDPEMRGTPGGLAICTFSIANNRRWKDQQGQPKEETSFFEIVAFGGTGETIYKHLSKGDPIFIEGRLQQDQWQDKTTGENRSKIKIVAERFEFLPRKGQERSEASPQRPSGGQGGYSPQPETRNDSKANSGDESNMPDDDSEIPF